MFYLTRLAHMHLLSYQIQHTCRFCPSMDAYIHFYHTRVYEQHFLSYKSWQTCIWYSTRVGIYIQFFILQELADMHLVSNKSWHIQLYIYSIFYPPRVGRHAFGIQQEWAYTIIHIFNFLSYKSWQTCIWYPTRVGIDIQFFFLHAFGIQ